MVITHHVEFPPMLCRDGVQQKQVKVRGGIRWIITTEKTREIRCSHCNRLLAKGECSILSGNAPVRDPLHTVCHSILYSKFFIPKLNGVVHKIVWRVTPECSPHAPPVPTPSYGIPCSLLGQRPGAFNCPLSVVMEENFFQYVPCPVYPERPCSDRIQRPFLLPFKLQYIAIKYFSWIFAFSPLRNANSGVAEKGACPDGGERPM